MVEDPTPAGIEPDAERTLPTESLVKDQLAPGAVLGKRYRIESRLGSGGMGEVWRAFDLRLRVDVALKVVLPELVSHSGARNRLCQEVLAARAVVSPNVCRVFDLVELDGADLVSMEYVDGKTLLDVVSARSPLDLGEAFEIALQLLTGLEAIHEAGFVHRDLKPENIMITCSGRVVVMDFGLAAPLEELTAASVSGTPAYMAPEQIRGATVDARADVFAAAVVLAEMVAPSGVHSRNDRETVWRSVRRQPPDTKGTPWSRALTRALATEPDERFASAGELARALEEVVVRERGATETIPYPGLAAFTENDAEHFFGREAEVELLWRRLQRPHLLAVIGPSGAGKSSFVRAGLLPACPAGWAILFCTPGRAPMVSLGQALVPALSGNTAAMRQLLRLDDLDVLVEVVSQWRKRHDEALLIIDQFEELFTQNPPEVQATFATAIARLALESDVRILLSLRDDFLLHCNDLPELAPVFSELTPLGPPRGDALRRALVQPAQRCGFRFESDDLVDEMVGVVEGERGALPLLAFAVSRLWEDRDLERRLLTRRAYEAMDGVGGALAQHAEATLGRVGADRIDTVREIFRNLVTPQGTRAGREVEELLSVFPAEDRGAASDVLGTLVDARLLTTFDVRDTEGQNQKLVEIIHESLLSAWPRLVRWQTQDADGAVLRDQLRQAAHLWNDRGRPDDLLWSGASYHELRLWRGRYTGGLTAIEHEFTEATDLRASRKRRRLRTAVAGAFVGLLAIMTALGGLWWRSEKARENAQTEARRATASRLFALGQLQDDRSVALAYAIASLELADTDDVRLFSLKMLDEGPVRSAFPASGSEPWSAAFTPDGRTLAVGSMDGSVKLWSGNGGPAKSIQAHEDQVANIEISPNGSSMLTSAVGETTVHLWSIPGGELMQALPLPPGYGTSLRSSRSWDPLILIHIASNLSTVTPYRWKPGDKRATAMAPLTIPIHGRVTVDLDARFFAMTRDREVVIESLAREGPAFRRVVGEHDEQTIAVAVSPDGKAVASLDRDGAAREWSITDPGTLPLVLGDCPEVPPAGGYLRYSRTGALLSIFSYTMAPSVWRLNAPPGAAPLRLDEGLRANGLAFHPDGRSVATTESAGTFVWNLDGSYPAVLRGHDGHTLSIAYSPDGLWLASAGEDGVVTLHPLSPATAPASRRLAAWSGQSKAVNRVVWDPNAGFVVAAGLAGRVEVLTLDGAVSHEFNAQAESVWTAAVSPSGRFIATSGWGVVPEFQIIEIRDLDTGEIRVIDDGDGRPTRSLDFVSDKKLLWWGDGAIRLMNLDSGAETTPADDAELVVLSRDRRWLMSHQGKDLRVSDLESAAEARTLPVIENGIITMDIDPDGRFLVTGDLSGTIRVRPLDGREPHLLLDHDGAVWRVQVAPDGTSIASCGWTDGTIKIWDVPDLEQPPLQSLPREEFLEHLKNTTNLRLLENDGLPGGYEVQPAGRPTW